MYEVLGCPNFLGNYRTGLAISLFDPHAYKSEQRREVIKRVSVFLKFLKKIQNPKPLFLALMSFEQDLMAIKVASNGYFMPIIYPNYLLMAISFELIWFSL